MTQTRSLLEVQQDINEYRDRNRHHFDERAKDFEAAQKMQEIGLFHPNDPRVEENQSALEQKWSWLTDPWIKLQQERVMAFHEQKSDMPAPARRRDHTRQLIDNQHPLSPYGERGINEDFNVFDASKVYYGPGGKLLDDEKKIIMIPGVVGANRASSGM